MFRRPIAYLALLGITALLPVHARGQDATYLNISFNGPDAQFPYMDTFYAAQTAYYQTLGRTPPGDRHCHIYVSFDVAEQAVGSGNVNDEGIRAGLEDWLSHAQGHCDEALITFSWHPGYTMGAEPPAPSDYETAFTTFQQTSWAYTGWTGTFAFTP